MRKERMLFVLILIALFLLPGAAFSAGPGLMDQEQGQGQGQLQGQAQGQLQAMGQGQGQSQSAVGIVGQSTSVRSDVDQNTSVRTNTDVDTSVRTSSAMSTRNNTENTTETNVQGDTNKNKTYANAWPSLSAGEGVNQGNIYSIFGGVGLSSTEKYKAYITQIQAVEASTMLTTEQKGEIVTGLVNKMIKSNKTQRFCGILWETEGRNLFNLFGILAHDSFWDEGQEPFHSKPKK